MHRWSDASQTPADLRPCVLSLGNFDGVHRGHKAVLAALVDAGRRLNLPAIVATFDPHPAAVLHPERTLELIAPGRIRDDLIAASGVDGLLVLEFTAEFARQSPEDFVRSVVVGDLDARAVVVGMDTRFGSRNSGDVATLAGLGEQLGFEVVALDDVGDGERFSSTVVRRLLRDGDVAEAARILGRPHRVVGTVVHGNHRGRSLGYPTANLAADSAGLAPQEGVYAGWLTRVDLPADAPDRTMPAAVSVGTNPTFDTDDRRTIEAYVLDRDDLDLYDETVLVEFSAQIRPTLRFDSVDDLIEAMAQDVARCRELLAKVVPV
ncbi:MAG: bifunctional riboflavin kinase/FAD synthetase [Dermatophilaceae bacterium]